MAILLVFLAVAPSRAEAALRIRKGEAVTRPYRSSKSSPSGDHRAPPRAGLKPLRIGIGAEWSLITTDRHDAFFTVPADGIRTSAYAVKFGGEWRISKRLRFHLRAGYRRGFYSNVGISEINKNYFSGDALLGWTWFSREDRSFSPYALVGASLLLGDSGGDGFATGGLGALWRLGGRFGLRSEATAGSDFTGVRAVVAAGVTYGL